MGPSRAPSLSLERRLMRDGAENVVGVDEVGRGSLAGPVSVGAVMVLPGTRSGPSGVKDSKLLSAAARESLAPRLRRWAEACAVGHASAEEIDVHGLIVALRLAAVRALRTLPQPLGTILLDGSHDWLRDAAGGLPELPDAGPVLTRIKADRDCTSVAAASVLAKVARDAIMTQLAEPADPYRWRENKGYAAPAHLQALIDFGPSPLHRLSWQLPGVTPRALQELDPQRLRTWSRNPQAEQLVLLQDPAAQPTN